ncbi:MAG: 1-deoxy-D-xylulose-5-phosphate synthase, partial [Lentisphaeria bacterium]|nr:1-deoxy-D-xylulose-5-phosphate synthase [Lentisphaeria bacterium]
MRKHEILDQIQTPADVKKLKGEQLPQLCRELREEIVDAVSHNGGHLAPNLGVVELTVALHRVFDLPKDKILWDVGHQTYAHKLLTGRRDRFATIRRYHGLSGFPSPEESEYDPFVSGHAGTSISAALGFEAANENLGRDGRVVAVIGDGSLICGLSMEALNNVRSTCKNLIIVINDNKMSISRSVGAIPNYLNRIITGYSYNRFKAFAKMALRKLPASSEIIGGIQKIEGATKSLFVPGIFFEELGLRYIGPVNGHKLPELIETFRRIREFNRPVIVHVITQKGEGYEFAERQPEKFHGVSGFDPDTGEIPKKRGGTTFSSEFGRALCSLAEEHPEVVGITAAMRSGTGMKDFSERFSERFYDVGIAEGHALTFAAGLAANGLHPVVSVYATFLQR